MSVWSGAVDGLWSNAGNWDVAPSAGDDLVFPSGASNTSNTNDLAADTAFASLTISGGSYTIGGNAIGLTGALTASQATGADAIDLPIAFPNASTIEVTNAGASLSLGGAIGGSAGLTKTGAGSLSLSATSPYSGTTTVSAGAVSVGGSLADSAISVGSGATLSGTGTVGAVASNGGTVRPGAAGFGTFTLDGTLGLTGGSTLPIALNGTTAGIDYGQVVVDGAVNLAGVTLSPTLGFAPTANESFVLIDNTSESATTGAFDGLAEGATLNIGADAFRITYAGGTGNDVVLTHLVASSTALTVSTQSPVFGQSVSLTATVSGSNSAVPTGSVQFFAGANSLGTAQLVDGVATLPTAALPLGVNEVTATYLGDDAFIPSSSTATVISVAQASSTVAVTALPSPSVFGQPVVLTATVAVVSPGSGTPTGNVQFFAGATTLGTGTLANGVATLTTPALPIGTSSITAIYVGDANFDGATSPAITHGTAQTITTTTLTAAPSPSNLGASVTLTATVTVNAPGAGTPTGTVQFFAGTTSLGTGTIANGVATLSTSAIPGGTNTLTATYSGDSNLAAGTSAPITQQVNKVASTTVLTATPNPSAFGESVTLTATVTVSSTGTPNPSGNVTFFNGTTSLGTGTLANGVATLTTTSLPVGASLSLTANYGGDTNYLADTSPVVTQQVTKAAANSTLTVTPNPSVVGQSVALRATVTPGTGTGTPSGTVEFFNGTTSLGTGTLANGVATLNVATLPLGTASLTFRYAGDNNFAAGTSPVVTATINQATTTVTLDASNFVLSASQAVTITASVTGTGTPTGTVSFFSDGNFIGLGVLSAGEASLTLRTLPIGFDTITALYSGDTNNVATTSDELFLDVGRPNEKFINQVYLVTLGQPLDLKGLLFWTNEMAKGRTTTSVARAIASTPAANRHAVQLAYQGYVGREATPREVARTLRTSRARGLDVRSVVLGSPAYYQQAGATTDAYLDSLAQDATGAPFSPQTQSRLASKINRGTAFDQVAESVVLSPAGHPTSVNLVYEQVLGGPPTDQEMASAIRLLNRKVKLRQIYISLLGSEEFYLTANGEA